MKCSKKEILNQFIIVLAPFAPHVCEELWETLGNAGSVCDAKWPVCNEEYLVENTVNYTVSFNGKARFNMEFPADAASEKWMEGKSIVKVIVVPKKIVNIVVK
jgi:leucyl-tRNA synthetase